MPLVVIEDINFYALGLERETSKCPAGRDSGNDFRVPEIGSDNSRFSFIVFW